MRPMTKRKLPIGIQTFREVREEGWYYVDKTACAQRLVDGGKHYFLSRPRRFGKSLFVDTLKELFEGNEPLFRGLAVHDGWDWSVRYPVVRLDFSAGDFNDPDYLREDLAAQLAAIERCAGLDPGPAKASIRFRQLLAALHERSGQRCWWTSTTGPSWTRWGSRSWPARTATPCVGSIRPSRRATRTSSSPSSPG